MRRFAGVPAQYNGGYKGISLFSGSISIPTIICELPAAIHSERLQSAHNLLSHKYANRQQLPLAKICHNRGSCLSGPEHRTGVCREFPHIRRSPSSIHGPSIHSFILTPGKHVTDARMRVPPRRRICRGSSEGWCSCDAAVTWRDAFPTSLRIKGRTSPCHVWNAPVHSGRGTGKSQAASCAVWGTRPRDRRRCRSCRGWGKRREALATSPACACKTRARGVIGVWSIDEGGRKFPLELD